MQPEYTAYQNSPHSRVECVQVPHRARRFLVRAQQALRRGPGLRGDLPHLPDAHPDAGPQPAPGARDLRSLPLAAEVRRGPPAGHSTILPTTRPTPRTKTVLLMKIGGGNHGIGIHGTHLGPGVHHPLRRTPTKRARTFPGWNTTTTAARPVYAAPDAKPDGAGLTMREMDCMDCHNRPTHTFELPERALDSAMSAGLISPALPFAKKKARRDPEGQLRHSRGSRAARFPRRSQSFYQTATRPSGRSGSAEVDGSAAGQVLAIYDRNIFPDMKVTWGTYPNNIGHTDFPGCFRCHDGSHAAKDGRRHHAGLQRLPQPAGHGRSQSEGADGPGNRREQAAGTEIGSCEVIGVFAGRAWAVRESRGFGGLRGEVARSSSPAGAGWILNGHKRHSRLL